MSFGETVRPGLALFWSAGSTLCVDLADRNEVDEAADVAAGLDEEDGR